MKTSNGYQIHNIGGDYVIHFLALIEANHERDGMNAITIAYKNAQAIAKPFGGRKFHNKRFGGGIAFLSEKKLNDCINSLPK